MKLIKIIFLINILFIFTIKAYSQKGKFILNDMSLATIQSADSGYISVGYKHSGSGSRMIWIVKTKKDFTKLWEFQLAKGLDAKANAVVQLSDGSFVIAGSFVNNNSKKDADIFLLKLNPSGKTVWESTFNYTGDESVSSVTLDSDNGFTLLAETNSFGKDQKCVLIINTDSSGKKIWENTIDDGILASKYLMRFCSSIIQTDDNGYIITGYKIELKTSETKIWAMKLDNKGGKIWEEVYSDASQPYVISPTSSGNFSIVGLNEHDNESKGKFIEITINEYGKLIGSKILGNNIRPSVSTVLKTVKGDYKVAGLSQFPNTRNIDFWVVDLADLKMSKEFTVYFKNLGDFKLDKQSKTDLENFVKSSNKLSYILLEGYTDSKGDEMPNIVLSKKRIKSINEILTTGGIAINVIVDVPYGETVAVATPETDKKGNPTDRKVTIKIFNN